MTAILSDELVTNGFPRRVEKRFRFYWSKEIVTSWWRNLELPTKSNGGRWFVGRCRRRSRRRRRASGFRSKRERRGANRRTFAAGGRWRRRRKYRRAGEAARRF